jgi:hypothetical protein
MKLRLVAAILLTAISVSSQEKQPDPPLDVNVSHRNLLYGGEAITPGYVWHPAKGEFGKDEWRQVKINNCGFFDFCGKPMTFKKAAFDKPALIWLGVAAIGRVADTEVTFNQPCMRAGTCREGNPILGGSRAQQYGVGFGMIMGIHFADAWLRKGNLRTNEGGWKSWWVVPLEQVGFNVLGVVLNSTGLHAK